MGNILIALVMVAQASGLFSEGVVWAVLFGVLLMAVVAYAIGRWVLTRERKNMEEEVQKMRAEHRTEMEDTKQGVLSGVSRDLLTPITLIITPLQELAAEPLSDDVRVRVQMILRNAQLLLHQVNMLPAGGKDRKSVV